MTNLLLTYSCPLPLKHELPYGGMAHDGRRCYVCMEQIPVVYCLGEDGTCKGCYETKSCCCAICHDPVDECFWAISRRRGGRVLRLNREFEEIDCITVPVGDQTLNSIAFDRQSDSLLLGSIGAISRVTKKGALICEHKAGGNHLNLAVAELHGSVVKATSYLYTSPNIIRLLPANLCPENITCLPDGHMCRSLCPVYRPDGSGIWALTTKKGKYSWLLKYRHVVTGGGAPEYCAPPEEDDHMVCIQEIVI